MKKTPLVFNYDYENEVITRDVKKGSEWVFGNDVDISLKIDGSACLFKDGMLWKRYDRRLKDKFVGKFKSGDLPDISNFRTPPEGFIPCEPNYDPKTFHWPGWVPINELDKFHQEALSNSESLEDGATYELVGPKIARNPYGLERHELWKHGDLKVTLDNISFDVIKDFLEKNYVEGIVFSHKDGRKAKIRRKDFNLFWQFEDLRRKRK